MRMSEFLADHMGQLLLRAVQEQFDKLSAKSERSRNELMCMALRFALEHLEFIPENGDK